MALINRYSYFRHIEGMIRLLGMPSGSSLGHGATFTDLQEELMPGWNPTRSRPLGYLLGIKWALWNMIQILEQNEDAALLEELKVLDDSTKQATRIEYDDAVSAHTASILREYYAVIHAIERTYYLNAAMASPSTKRLDKLADQMKMNRALGGKAESEDKSVMAYATFTSKHLTEVDSKLISTRLALAESKLSRGLGRHMNLSFEIAGGATASILTSTRHKLGNDNQGTLEYMRRVAEASNSVARFNNLMEHQHNILITEFKLAAKKSNQLAGKTADSRLLLVDSGIPVPHPATAIAWLGLCSMGVWQDSVGDHYAVCIPPHMPMTYEHKNHGGITDLSSDLSHSLPSKSTGHKKNRWGGIDYGQRVALLYKLPKSGKPALMNWKILPTASLSPMAICADLFGTMNLSLNKLRDSDKLPARKWNELTNLQWQDPFTHGNQTESNLYWHSTQPLRGTFADEPMRAVAIHKIHFRFDEHEPLLKWTMGYMESLQTFLNQNPLAYDLHTAGTAAAYDSVNLNHVVAAKGGNRMKLKFD